MEESVVATKYSKKVENLRKQKYVVRPIRRKGGWVGPDHDSAFMNDGARIGIVVPVKSGNVLVDPLKVIDKEWTDEDRQLFADELGLEGVQSLNVHVQKNYWRGNTVFLDRNGLHLDLQKTEDFVQFLILRSDTERISPNWALRFERGTFKFALCEEGEELQDKVSNLEEKAKAFEHFNKMKTSAEKMKDLLYVYYLTKKDAKRPPKTGDVDWLKQEIGRIIEDDLRIFLEILDDPNYSLKLLIQKSVEVGALLRNKHSYSLPGADRPIGVIEDVIEYLDDERNQDVRMKLMHQTDTTKKKK